MIPRYSRPEMQKIWSDVSRFEIWLEIETLALEAMIPLGLAPQSALEAVKKVDFVSAERVHEIEDQVHHDVIAFLTAVAEKAGPEARYLHRGMTSNDLLDTTFAVQLKRSGEMILREIDSLLSLVRDRAFEFKFTPCIGRSHGIHAEPITFGLKIAGWYAELKRQKQRLIAAFEDVAVGKISGPVGTYASIPPDVESTVLNRLGLKPETVATQVVARDRHANVFSALAQLGGTFERICVEIRHLQRTEVGEAEEPFGSQQKGSSAMPHKKNPILTENMTGLARLLRSYVVPAFENVALWHERDISHSSVERVVAPDACILADFLVARMKRVISGLVVHPEKMQQNLDLTGGKVFSGTLLLALVDAGITRESAYRMVQELAMSSMTPGSASFQELVRKDNAFLQALGPDKLNACFSLDHHMQYVDFIFARTFEETGVQ
ncbi:MAG: adenylosuccinate lyase [Bdellovibrionales bacterium]|nr:adenylosuccinate lyase [Bdellovibrionales bacterium]